MLKELRTGTGGILVCLILLYVPETHSWMVQHNDKVCMIMTFNASVEFNADGVDIATFIPLNALSDGSVCGQSFSIFHLEYDLDDDHEVTLSFGFNKTKSDWLMSDIKLELYNLNTSMSYVQSTKSGFEEFITPLGHYLQCESQVKIKDISLNFTEIETMQPFATSEDPGEEHECEADHQGPDDSNTGLIVGCVLAAMAVAVISCCVWSRMQNRRRDRYRHSRSYVR